MRCVTINLRANNVLERERRQGADDPRKWRETPPEIWSLSAETLQRRALGTLQKASSLVHETLHRAASDDGDSRCNPTGQSITRRSFQHESAPSVLAPIPRRSLDTVANRAKTLRQSDESRVSELHTGSPSELHLLFPSDDPVAIVPPDQRRRVEAAAARRSPAPGHSSEIRVPGHSHDAPLGETGAWPQRRRAAPCPSPQIRSKRCRCSAPRRKTSGPSITYRAHVADDHIVYGQGLPQIADDMLRPQGPSR